jgi:hypothetical protein
MSADNRGRGVTYRERKKRKDGDRLSFWLCFSFGFRGTGGVTYKEGKGKDGDWLSFWLRVFFFCLRGTGGADSRDRRWLVTGYNASTAKPVGLDREGWGRLFICLFISSDVKCMAGYCVLFSSSLSFFVAPAPLHHRYLLGR